jgi:hypothetical protein
MEGLELILNELLIILYTLPQNSTPSNRDLIFIFILRGQQLNGIALGYGLDYWEFESRLRAAYFSTSHRVQTGSGAHLASYPMDTRGSFPGSKEAWT